MKLLRLVANGFGPLRGEYRFAPDRLTLIVDENERGKTSLLSAITAALYGLEDDARRHRPITPIERWRPWEGQGYRLELEVECEGTRYSIQRDFERGTVAVWDDHARERTLEFREGKDAYPIGSKLLGLDADEFEKSALVRQGELDQVVPGDEKARRGSTLSARLENAADTRLGDTNATEALRVLEQAAARYDCPEIEATVRVETALQRLDLKVETLASDLHALGEELRRLGEPLETLAQLTAEERALRAEVHRLEQARRAARAGEPAVRLRENDSPRATIERLEAEARSLMASPRAAAGSDAELRAMIGRIEAAERQRVTLEEHRQSGEAERQRREAERRAVERYAGSTAEDADRLAARAQELRALDRELAGLHHELETSAVQLHERGLDPERSAKLIATFESLSGERLSILREHPHRALEFQTRFAEVDGRRIEATEGLRSLDAARGRRMIPGWIAIGLAFAAGAAGAVIGILDAAGPWMPPVAAASGLLAIGASILMAAGLGGRREREQAQALLSAAESERSAIRAEQIEFQEQLRLLTEEAGFSEATALIRDWNDYVRLVEARAPLVPLQQRAGDLERRREALWVETHERLLSSGDEGTTAEDLERASTAIRQHLAARQRLDDLERDRAWVEEQIRANQAAITDLCAHGESIARAAAIDAELDRARARLDEIATQCADSRVRFEEKWRLTQTAIDEKSAERDRFARALARARRFKAAIDLARETLARVASETHRRWAEFLNQRVGEIVRSVGTDIAQVRFGDDLDFSVRLPNDTQVPRGRAMLHLSSGARDQLHLAVRVAISEYLSAGRPPLPFLIDDCFATSDDQRAGEGMKLLIEHVAAKHQVILATCHRGRAEALAARDPDLYRERVHWIDVRAAAVEASRGRPSDSGQQD